MTVTRSAKKVLKTKEVEAQSTTKATNDETLITSPAKEQTSDGRQKPRPGYLDGQALKKAVSALNKYVSVKLAQDVKPGKPKDLLEAGNDDDGEQKRGKTQKVICEVVFKNIPANSKTYIHNVQLPHHWRLTLEPEDYDMAVFVPHRKPQTEAEKIQFSKDRDLDIANTHAYYEKIFEERLDKTTRARISRIISSMELATEFNTYQKLDRLSKTYDLFLGDKRLMANKMNAFPRQLGRRFWVRERKVPIIVKFEAKNLAERFQKALSTEPFYVIGQNSTERIQLGLLSQKPVEIAANIKAFLDKLYGLYGDQVRFIKLRSNSGFALPMYADLTTECPKRVQMLKKRIKPEPIIGDFDLLPDGAQVKVHAHGLVRVIQPDTKTKRKAQESPAETQPSKKRAKN